MPVLDTTFLIDLKRRPGLARGVLDRIVAGGDEGLLVPMQVAIEYASGEADVARAFRDLSASFVVAPLDEAVAREAATLARAARARGLLPGWADAQIAATARYHGMYVVTRNVRHFRDAFGIRVWDYGSEATPPE